MFSGCKSDNSTSSTPASQSEVAAKLPSGLSASDLSEDVVGGKSININPTLTFSSDGSTLTYQNDSNDSGYPATVSGSISVTSTKDGDDKLLLTFTVGGQEIEIGFSFIDRGGEGYIDEAVLETAKVDDIEQTISQKVTVTMATGKIENAAVSSQDRLDISGAPDLSEWNRYIVGTAFFCDNSARGEILFYFTSSTSGKYFDMEDGDSGDVSYSYKPTGANTGEISLTADYPGTGGHTLRDDWKSSLTFTNFYNGSFVDLPGGTTTDLNTGKVVHNWTVIDSGTFNAITNVSVYLEENSN